MRQEFMSGSSSSALSPTERAVCEYWADAETMRMQPRCPAAYRATVFQRKQAEILAQRAFHVEHIGRVVDTVLDCLTPEVPYEAPIDPLLARAARAAGIEAGRAERAELLAKMRDEQGRDPSWH